MPSSCPPFTSEAAFPTDVHGYSCSVFDRTVGFRGSGAPPLVRWSRRFMRSGLGVSPLGAPRPVISVDLGCGSCVWFVTDLRDPASGVLLASLLHRTSQCVSFGWQLFIFTKIQPDGPPRSTTSTEPLFLSLFSRRRHDDANEDRRTAPVPKRS